MNPALAQKIVTAALLLLGFVCVTPRPTAAADAPPMLRQIINLPAFPDALCNDGTLPVFYFQPGAGDGRNRWLILFQDGGSCTSDAACAARLQANRYFLTGSADAVPATAVPDGILSPLASINPDFSDYNRVLLHYCSSDGYAGDGDRQINGVTWHFRGKQIVDALIEQLKMQPPADAPSLGAASDVLVAGSSAGAMGVHNNLDRIAARLPSVRVMGVADSGWVPDVVPFAFGTFAARPDRPAAMTYFSARPDDSCVAANPAKPAACLSEAFAFPYVTTPMFVYADQRDQNILAMLGIAASPTSEDEADYVTGYAAAVRETLRTAVPAYFAANVTIHNVLLWTQFAKVSESGEALGDIIHNWYFGTPGDIRVAAPGPGNSAFTLSR